MCTAIDIASACDNVNICKLATILTKFGIPGPLVRFIFNVFSNHAVYGICDGSLFRNDGTNKGLPQGSCLSPLLFNLYIHEISVKILPNDIRILAFADDVTVYFIGPLVEVGIQKIKEAPGCVDLFLCNLSLLISFVKCCLIIFGEPRIAPGTVSIRIRVQNLFNVDHSKYLGLVFDGGGTWDTHIDALSNKVTYGIKMLDSGAGFH